MNEIVELREEWSSRLDLDETEKLIWLNSNWSYGDNPKKGIKLGGTGLNSIDQFYNQSM